MMSDKKIGQAIYKLSRSEDYFNQSTNPISIAENNSTWDDSGNNKVTLLFKKPVTKLGIQAEPKTLFKFEIEDDQYTQNMVIGRSGIYEVEGIKIYSIVFYNKEKINSINKTVTADDTELQTLRDKYDKCVEWLSNINTDLTDYTSTIDGDIYIVYDSNNKFLISEAQHPGLSVEEYWNKFDENKKMFDGAYAEKFLTYKKQLYGTYGVVSMKISNVIVDYEYESQDNGGTK